MDLFAMGASDGVLRFFSFKYYKLPPDTNVINPSDSSGITPNPGIISAFPVPATEILSLVYKVLTAGSAEISIYDFDGNLIITESLDAGTTGDKNAVIPIKGLAPGTYYYIFKNGSNTQSGKFIKIK
jgi:hypothetical protein